MAKRDQPIRNQWFQVKLSADEKARFNDLVARSISPETGIDNASDLFRDMVNERIARLDKAESRRKKTAQPE